MPEWTESSFQTVAMIHRGYFIVEEGVVLQNKRSAVADMGDRLATVDMGRKVGGFCAPFFFLGGGAGSPSSTIWPGPRPTSVPSGVWMHLHCNK